MVEEKRGSTYETNTILSERTMGIDKDDVQSRI